MERPSVRLLLSKIRNNKPLEQAIKSHRTVLAEDNIKLSAATSESLTLDEFKTDCFMNASITAKIHDYEPAPFSFLQGAELDSESRRFKKKFSVRLRRASSQADRVAPLDNLKELGIQQKNLCKRGEKNLSLSRINNQQCHKRQRLHKKSTKTNFPYSSKRNDRVHSNSLQNRRNRTLDVNYLKISLKEVGPKKENRKNSDICPWEIHSPY